MTSAHASVGNAAACPTTGTTLITAEVIRHGAAARPQPLNPKQAAQSAASKLDFIQPLLARRSAQSAPIRQTSFR
jgi:hypothetical protein